MSPNEQLAQVIQDACMEKEGRKTLACAEAFRIAKEAEVDLLPIAQYCNRNDIKLVQCQLGCF